MERRKLRGFTLIELLVTLAIVALIMTALLGTLQSTLTTHDEIATELSSVRDGPRILDMIDRDLRGLHLYNVKDQKVLLGSQQRPNGLRGDRIDFISVNDSQRRLPDPSVKGDDPLGVASNVNEIGYRLRPCADSSDFLELWRREDLFVDDDPFNGGTYEKIHDRVHRFEITYLDSLGVKTDQFTDWDMTDKKHLPAAIQVDLEIQCAPEVIGGSVETKVDERRLYHYRRVIPIPTDETTALNVRPALPIKITARQSGQGGTGNGSGGGGGGTLAGGTGANGMNGAGSAGSGDNNTKTKKDMGGGTLDPSMSHPFWSLDPSKNMGNFSVGVGNGGALSPDDEKKIEDFMNDYKNRFSLPGGNGGTSYRRGHGKG